MTEAYIFELSDTLQERLQPLANAWREWILTHPPKPIALQLAAYQTLAQAGIDKEFGDAWLEDFLDDIWASQNTQGE